MKKIILLLALSLMCLTAFPQVVPNIDWVKYFSERAFISNVPSAIDANNNVYITGYTYPTTANSDITTVKYDAAGNVVWVKHYDNGGNDDANGIKIDASGNIFIVGESDGTGTGKDLVIIKYDANGNQLFATRYDGTGNGNDIANAISLDGTSSAFVTGKTTITGGTTNYITLKFNANTGAQQWVSFFNGTGNNNDESIAIDFSSTGRLFITGNSRNASGNDDITTIRLNPNNGNQVWAKTINGTANNNDRAYALLSDGNDVVTVGSLNNLTTTSDYLTIKYNGNNGNTLWQKNYDNGNSANAATSIVKDASNNFVVTGLSLNGSIYEYHSIMYNNNGVQQWVNIVSTGLGYSNANPQIAVDPIANHFYVCGQKNTNVSDILVYQITPAGNKTWEETFNGAQNNQDAAVDLVVNSQGVIYVAGASLNSNAKFDYTTIRISQTPVYVPIDLTATTNDKSFLFYENIGQEMDINLNPINDIKFVTNSSPKYYFKSNRLSMVFAGGDLDSNGVDTIHRIDLQFEKSNERAKIYSFEAYGADVNYILGQLGTTSSNKKGTQRLMIPNIYQGIDLHYYSNRNGGLKYYFVVKPGTNPNQIMQSLNSINYSSSIDPNGKLNIKSSVGEINLSKPIAYQVNLLGQPVALSGASSWSNIASNSYGFSLPSYNTSLPLIIMVNQDAQQSSLSTVSLGNLKWSTFIGGGDDDQSWAITVDQAGNQHVAGATSSLNFPTLGFQIIQAAQIITNSRYAFYSKFNSSHQQLISTYIGGNGQTDAFDVKVNSVGDAYIVGTTQATNFLYKLKTGAYNDTAIGSTANNAREDCFIVKLTAANQYVWGTYFGGTNNDNGRSCAIDKNDNLYLTGSMRSVAMPLVPNGSAYQQVWLGSDDGFIAKFNASDNLTWYTYYGGSSYDNMYSCKTDANNNLFITGNTYGGTFPTYRANSSYYKDSTFSGTSDMFILKFNANGVRQWSTLYGGSGEEYSTYYPTQRGIAFDKLQNIYIVDNTNSTDLFTKKESSSALYDSTFGGQVDGFLLKFSSTLQLKHATYIGGTNYDYAHAIAFDSNDNCYISYGTNNNGITTTPIGSYYQQNSLNVPSPNNAVYAADNFLLSLNTALVPRWATYIGGTSYNAQGDEGTEIAISGTDMYLTGYCNSYNANTTDVRFPIFYPGSPAYIDSTYNDLTQANKADGFISKLDLSALVGIDELELNSTTQFFLFPNPSSDLINVKFNSHSQEKIYISVYSVDGKEVFKTQYPIVEGINLIQLNTSHLSSGLYILKLTGEKTSLSSKFIKND